MLSNLLSKFVGAPETENGEPLPAMPATMPSKLRQIITFGGMMLAAQSAQSMATDIAEYVKEKTEELSKLETRIRGAQVYYETLTANLERLHDEYSETEQRLRDLNDALPNEVPETAPVAVSAAMAANDPSGTNPETKHA